MIKKTYLHFFCFLLFKLVEATPSTSFWTECTTDVYDKGILHLDQDNFVSIFPNSKNNFSFPPDIGFEIGFLDWHNLKAEIGIDYLVDTTYPLFFNFGIGVEENKLSKNAPAIKISAFNFGTHYRHKNQTNQNIINVIIGKSFPEWIGGRICVSAYSGNQLIGKNRQGIMCAYQRNFCPTKYKNGKDYFKWEIIADYASGKNVLGGGGIGIYYYFTPDIVVSTGPVFFNSKKINGNWKWAVQIDIDISVF